MLEYMLLRLSLVVRGRFGGRGETGASLVEYALLLALILLVAILAITFVGGSTANQLNNTGQSMFNSP
ncbi:MAG TPA: hypothetical protein VE991_10865 [Acidimicrobiales bacterium]|nr:hypothetical protein [Acidimicrobiales bacterium]